jgi:hypothetical protein
MAKLTGMFTTKLWSSGDFEGTVDINFPPQETFGDASIAILVFFDDGWSITQGYMGVRSYRVRPTATGAEHEVHLAVFPRQARVERDVRRRHVGSLSGGRDRSPLLLGVGMSLLSAATVEIQSERACVVYHPRTGRILHLHRVITLRGGREPGAPQIEARALALAAKKRRGPMRVLHVDPAALTPGVDYKVDVKKMSLSAARRKSRATSTGRQR